MPDSTRLHNAKSPKLSNPNIRQRATTQRRYAHANFTHHFDRKRIGCARFTTGALHHQSTSEDLAGHAFGNLAARRVGDTQQSEVVAAGPIIVFYDKTRGPIYQAERPNALLAAGTALAKLLVRPTAVHQVLALRLVQPRL